MPTKKQGKNLIEYIKSKFTNKISNINNITIKGNKKEEDSIESCSRVNKSIRGLSSSPSSLNKLEFIPRYGKFYLNDKEHPTSRNKKWLMSSMIHSLHESFNFVLYNGSHCVQNNDVVHYNSRIML